MNKITIRAKITTWYAVSMILMVSIMLGLLVMVSESMILSDQKKRLIDTIEDIVEDLEEDDEEEIDSFEDGMYISRYSKSGKLIDGFVPSDIKGGISFKEGVVSTIKGDNQNFYVYDRGLKDGTWIRGAISGYEASKLQILIIKLVFILLPVLVVFSCVAGYFVTKKAFKPVRHIQETAQKIARSKALSSRIGFKEGRDEISQLGNTIDEMLEKLEQSFEKERQFTSNASHELRTPVSVILMESEYALEHIETLQEAQESMKVINRQANRMSEMINQLLFFARDDNRTLSVNFQDVEINYLLTEIVEDNWVIANNSKVSIEFNSNLPDKFTCSIDRILFSRAVQNIIQNAIVYGKQGGNILVNIDINEEYLIVKVKDNGIGISKDDIGKIWDRFYRVDKARSSENSGSTGLGLSMVNAIMKIHNGYAKVESEENLGSTFTLYFNRKVPNNMF